MMREERPFDILLKSNLDAGISAIYVESSDWMRFREVVAQCCKDKHKPLYFWNPIDGVTTNSGNAPGRESDLDSLENACAWISAMEENSVCVLELADSQLLDALSSEHRDGFAVMVRKLQDGNMGKYSDQTRHVILISSGVEIPASVRHEFEFMSLPPPETGEIRKILKQVRDKCQRRGKPMQHCEDHFRILDAVRGLGWTEIYNAFSKVAVARNRIGSAEIPELMAVKEQIIRKSGYLEYIRPDIEMKSVGGLENLKEWLNVRRKAFGSNARKAKLDPPKGVLLLGIPGTGKSLCAKAAADIWEMPLLRLDMAAIYNSALGGSEANIRNAIRVAEGLAPCILWVDEIEKGLSGGASVSGERDGGTSVRVFGTLLTWMQEKTKEVFVFATANNIEHMPPELMRKGRFDEIFFVDMPSKKQQEEILKIHLKKRGQDEEKIKPKIQLLVQYMEKTEKELTGAEIEAVVKDAQYACYAALDGDGDDSPLDINVDKLMEAIDNLKPLLRTHWRQVARIQRRAKENGYRLANKNTNTEEKRK